VHFLFFERMHSVKSFVLDEGGEHFEYFLVLILNFPDFFHYHNSFDSELGLKRQILNL